MVKEWITKEIPKERRPVMHQEAYWVRMSPSSETMGRASHIIALNPSC